MFIPMNELLKMPWYFALLLIAEDRIALNFDSHKVLSWSVEDMPDRIVSDAMKRSGNAASDNYVSVISFACSDLSMVLCDKIVTTIKTILFMRRVNYY